jgi:hypothetical protein
MMGEAAPPPKCPHHRGIGESHILFFKEFSMEHEQEKSGRTRMNVSITAKGAAQWDITAEYATPEETQANLADAITRVRATIEAKGLKEATA